MPLALASCFYVGGTARTTFDLESRKPVHAAYGYFGAFAGPGLDDESVVNVDDRHSGYFALSMGIMKDERLDRWKGLVGPRIGWLWPHGFTEIGIDMRIGSDDPNPIVGVMLTVGPRIEVRRTGTSGARGPRSATVISGGAVVGFSAGDGFRPEIGGSLGASHHFWNPNARYD